MPLTQPLDALPEVWDFLDRFLQQLQHTNQANRQLRATLEMIHGASNADSVLLFCATRGQVIDQIGTPLLETEAAVRRAGELVAAAGMVDAKLMPEELAAVVRLSRTTGTWIVALRGAGQPPFTPGELKLMTLARRLLVSQQQQQQTHDQLRDLLFGLVRCLTSALDARDPYTWGHSERVARIAVRLAEQLGLSESARSELYLGGLMHDIGKIGVPDEILRKPGKLTEEEFEKVKQHTVIGDAIVGHIAQLAHLRPLVRNHHEQYDGGGYPDGLAGDIIPVPARILAVADACDAMMSDRPYRKSMPQDRIEAILREGSGKQWDPLLIKVFFACKADVFAIYQRGLGESVRRAVDYALSSSGPRAPSILLPRASDHDRKK